MPKITLNLITGRTIQQGVAMEAGKNHPAYREACGIIELDKADFKRLGAWPNTNVRVNSAHGTVVVKAVPATQGPHPGIAFIPMGPWANRVINPYTYSTGTPTFKGTPIEVEPAQGEVVLDGIQVVYEVVRGGKK
ncbi:MAG: molybdopterin dinucleotide-binding protein [Methanomicrobiales archaeon]|nr:molybdopterin dinucleotide-binding protein [Methanomicrobiales archaeon]